MNVSKAGIGMYATIVVAILQLVGVDADEGLVTEVILAMCTVVSFLTWVYGQVDRKDLTIGLWRK